MTFEINDITNDSKIEEKKNILKKVLRVEQEAITYRSLHLPLLRWLYQYETNKIDTFRFGWAHFSNEEWEKEINNPQNILSHIGQLIITLASSYELHKDDSEIIENEYGLIKNIKALSNINSGFQSQVVRLFAASLLLDKNLLISDIDMLPLNGNYFSEKAKDINDDEILVYSGQPYCNVPYHPMCYN